MVSTLKRRISKTDSTSLTYAVKTHNVMRGAYGTTTLEMYPTTHINYVVN